MRRGSHQPLGLRVLGRLPPLSVALGALALLAACEDRGAAPSVTRDRSQVVTANRPGAGAPASAARTGAPPASAPGQPAAGKPARELCGGRLAAGGDALPEAELGRAQAPGEAALPPRLTTGGGQFTWVNFWAAWCVPCKEEVPRLLGWQRRLAAKLRVAFVSLDDDPRQRDAFLAAQPPGGLRATWWLEEGKPRTDWLGKAGLDTDPSLPVHLLVDPAGKVRCRVEGAVEDADFASVARLVGG